VIYRDLAIVGVLAALLATSGLFSAAEMSFLALGRYRARRVSAGRPGVIIDKLIGSPAMTLSAILVTITALNYTAEAVATSWVVVHGLPVWVAIVVVGTVLVIFAEVVPISYAAANAERVARALAVPVWIVSALVSLPARVVGFVAERLVRAVGGHPAPREPVTEGEIRAIVDLQAETGALEEEEKMMIHQIFAFGDKVAREVMVPRTDVKAIPETATASEASELAAAHRVSRLPVYRGDLDKIVGLVHVKDVLPLIASGKGGAGVTSVMRPAFRVPETKRLSDLLTDFRRLRRTLAIVVDEYGGTAGLVTLEDLLEEVVGDIYDEYDVVRPAVERLPNGALAVDGRMSIGEASEALGVVLPDGDYDSLGGLLYSHLGMVPRLGQSVALEGVTLTVDELDGHRITRVRAALAPPESEGSA
jgi:putative hemolysin